MRKNTEEYAGEMIAWAYYSFVIIYWAATLDQALSISRTSVCGFMEGGFGSDKKEPRNTVAHEGRGSLVKEPWAHLCLCLYFGELGWTHGKFTSSQSQILEPLLS